MEYRVEELASEAQTSVDTIRFYQGKGLLPAPQKRGRIAIYGSPHLDRLQTIRALMDQGLPLALVKRVIDRTENQAFQDESLLDLLTKERSQEPSYTKQELIQKADVSKAVVNAAEKAGLIEALTNTPEGTRSKADSVQDRESRFSKTDLEILRAGGALLKIGLPLEALLQLARTHTRQVQKVADEAIELFNQSVRKNPNLTLDADTMATELHTLLPQVTALVALHFQRTLLNRGLHRLAQKTEDTTSKLATPSLAATESRKR